MAQKDLQPSRTSMSRIVQANHGIIVTRTRDAWMQNRVDPIPPKLPCIPVVTIISCSLF